MQMEVGKEYENRFGLYRVVEIVLDSDNKRFAVYKQNDEIKKAPEETMLGIHNSILQPPALEVKRKRIRRKNGILYPEKLSWFGRKHDLAV